MIFHVANNVPHAELQKTATKVKQIGVCLRGFQIMLQVVCCIGLSYALTNPGYWTNFLIPCSVTYSVAFLSVLFDAQQLFLYGSSCTGSTIVQNDVNPKEVWWFLKKAYGIFLFMQLLSFLGWAVAALVLTTTVHGKNFRYAFNTPPYTAWYISTVAAYVICCINWPLFFIVSKEWNLLKVQRRRYETASAPTTDPIELREIPTIRLSRPSDEAQEYDRMTSAPHLRPTELPEFPVPRLSRLSDETLDISCRGDPEEVHSVHSEEGAAQSHQVENPFASLDDSPNSKSKGRRETTDLAIRPGPITEEAIVASVLSHYYSDRHVVRGDNESFEDAAYASASASNDPSASIAYNGHWQ